MEYSTFLQSKRLVSKPSGFDVPDSELNPAGHQWQNDIVRWNCKRGKSATFARYGLGKTFMLLSFSWQTVRQTNKPVLVLAPLGVAKQTAHIEAAKFGFDAVYCASQDDVPVQATICVTNYEKLHRFDASAFGGIVLDEGSVIKDFAGKRRNQLIGAFQYTPYRLITTATPAPNDYTELGNYSHFLDILKFNEVRAKFFEHDGGDTSKWKMMAWGEQAFWQWLASWAMVLRSPADLGYDDTGYNLPPLTIHEVDVALAHQEYVASEGLQLYLLPVEARGLKEQRNARKVSLQDRIEATAARINASNEQWMVWGDTNPECDLAEKQIKGAVQVAGSDTEQFKEDAWIAFVRGDIQTLISKPKIYGHGLNGQHCHNAYYLGWSNSFEQFDQSLHRLQRYGQLHRVHAYVNTTEMDGSIVRNIERKRREYDAMMDKVIAHTKLLNIQAVRQSDRMQTDYQPAQAMRVPAWL